LAKTSSCLISVVGRIKPVLLWSLEAHGHLTHRSVAPPASSRRTQSQPKNGTITCGMWFSLASHNRADYLLIPIKFLHYKFLAVI